MFFKKVILKLKREIFGYGISENVNNTNFKNNCLLKYIVAPFKNTITNFHQNQWQVKKLAEIISEFEYNVDVINFDDKRVKLKKTYDLIIDLHPGLNNVRKNFMPDMCLKVAYITGSNPSFSNRAEMERIKNLHMRKGVWLKQRRYVKPFDKSEFESFDAMFFIGNQYNLQTYNEFDLNKVKVFFVKNTGYPFLANYDFFEKSAKNFLVFASSGQVHKGLDLLLDIFKEDNDLNLYICSNFKAEKDFCKLYNEELFHTKNIFPVGFIDIKSSKFRKLTNKCSYVVMPSCAEANAGSILTAMSAGLIPIVSRECGFEDDEVHFFDECSVSCLEKTIVDFSQKDNQWIQEESVKVMGIIKNRYSGENYIESIRNAMKGLLDIW